MESCEMVLRFCWCRDIGSTPPMSTSMRNAIHRYRSSTRYWSFMVMGRCLFWHLKISPFQFYTKIQANTRNQEFAPYVMANPGSTLKTFIRY